MAITREIEDTSQYFEGEPERGWELVSIKEGQKCFAYYYQDRQGGWHHRTVKKKATYNPFETQLREEGGAVFARVVHKKTGKPIRA